MAFHEVDIWNRALSRVGNTRLVLEAAKTVTGITAVKFPVVSITSHGYSDGDRVLLMDMDEMTEVNGRVFEVYNAGANDFELRYEDATGYTAETTGGECFKLPTIKATKLCHDAWEDVRDEVLRAHPWNIAVKRSRLSRLEAAKTINAATNANPIACTTSAAHGYSTGDQILIGSVASGMVEIGDRWFTITVTSTTEFTLDGEDGTDYGTFAGTVSCQKALDPLTPDSDYAHRYSLPSDCLRPLDLVDSREEWVREGDEILTDAGITVPFRYIWKQIDVTAYDPTLVQAMAGRLAVEICEELTQSNTKRETAFREYEALLSQAKRAEGQEQSPMDFEEDDWVLARF